MVTPQKADGRAPYYGLSTDEKPTGPAVANGSFYIYIDRIGTDLPKLACYDAENEKWYPEEEGA